MFSEITVASQFCFAISARLTATSFGPLFAQCQATLSRRQSFRNDAQPPSIVYPVERADLSTRIGRPRACIRPTLFSRLTATSLGKKCPATLSRRPFSAELHRDWFVGSSSPSSMHLKVSTKEEVRLMAKAGGLLHCRGVFKVLQSF